MSNPESPEAVPCFDSVQQYQNGLAARRNFDPIDLYPRDGTIQLCETEADLAKFARVDEGEVVLVNSGMTAIDAALRVAIGQKRDERRVVAHARELYGQTLVHMFEEVSLSCDKIVTFDSGDPDSVEQIFAQHQPNIVLTETVSNGSEVSVLDMEAFKDSVAKHSPDAFVILDNTLPQSTALPLGEQLTAEENFLVVASATKASTLNAEIAGMVHSKNSELIHSVRQVRRRLGMRPGLASSELIQTLLPKTVEAFDERNKLLYAKTGELALDLYDAEHQGADFIVSHPSLASHPNYGYANEHYPDGVAPLLSLQCTGAADQFQLKDRLWQHPVVRENAELGQSFGLNSARILADEHGLFVRVAAGAHTDSEALGKALKEAALNK